MNAVLSSRANPRGRVDTLTEVDEQLTQHFLELYREAFAPLDELAPARQGLTDDEFIAQMADDSVVKVVGYNHSGEPVALTFMSAALGTVPWISPAYFERRFPEQAARHALFYFGGLVVRAADRGMSWTILVLEEAYRHVARAGGVAIFDCCTHNVDRNLPALLERVGRRVCELETEELEPQRYFAYTTKGLK